MLRENSNGLYRVDAYFLAKVLVDMPFDVSISWTIMTLMYLLIGLNDGAKAYFLFITINALMVEAGQAFGKDN